MLAGETRKTCAKSDLTAIMMAARQANGDRSLQTDRFSDMRIDGSTATLKVDSDYERTPGYFPLEAAAVKEDGEWRYLVTADRPVSQRQVLSARSFGRLRRRFDMAAGQSRRPSPYLTCLIQAVVGLLFVMHRFPEILHRKHAGCHAVMAGTLTASLTLVLPWATAAVLFGPFGQLLQIGTLARACRLSGQVSPSLVAG